MSNPNRGLKGGTSYYTCHLCADDKYREGGIPTATQHFRDKHTCIRDVVALDLVTFKMIDPRPRNIQRMAL